MAEDRAAARNRSTDPHVGALANDLQNGTFASADRNRQMVDAARASNHRLRKSII
jgi:hypothetical protein